MLIHKQYLLDLASLYEIKFGPTYSLGKTSTP